ncbi:ATP-binding cassette domain-containing protein [Streptomyces zhihengii]
MGNANSSAIRTVGLGRDFAERTAVHGLDLEVNPGEVYGLLGPNGSGKSTAVRMLTTMLRPSRGSAVVAGADVVRDPEAVRRRIGVVLQQTALDPLMSARELLLLQGRLQSLTAPQARARCEELIARFGADEFADTATGKLSGAGAAGSISPSPWSSDRTSSSWTNPPPGSTRPAAGDCGTSCAHSPPTTA